MHVQPARMRQCSIVWRGVQDRGDYFYKTGNYKAAINAYTASLQVGVGSPAPTDRGGSRRRAHRAIGACEPRNSRILTDKGA